MGEGAKLESIDALKYFRVGLIKFIESANTALADAESDLGSELNWLETEQTSHWQNQIRKRHDDLEKAKEALRMKQLFRDSAGRLPYAIEEEKAVARARARKEEAEQKLLNVKKYIRVLAREIQAYKGSVQRLATSLSSDLPTAVAMLGCFATTLEQYTALAPADAPAAAPTVSESGPTEVTPSNDAPGGQK